MNPINWLPKIWYVAKSPVRLIGKMFDKEKPKGNYPADYCFIEFTPMAFRLGLKDDKNKIIIRKTLNDFGKRTITKYRYSQERAFILQQVHKVPIYDKTQNDVNFPILSHINPGEVVFTESK